MVSIVGSRDNFCKAPTAKNMEMKIKLNKMHT